MKGLHPLKINTHSLFSLTSTLQKRHGAQFFFEPIMSWQIKYIEYPVSLRNMSHY